MTKSKLNAALEIARAATHGEWISNNCHISDFKTSRIVAFTGGRFGDGNIEACQSNAEHIAQFSPAFVIPLIEAHLEALEVIEYVSATYDEMDCCTEFERCRRESRAFLAKWHGGGNE